MTQSADLDSFRQSISNKVDRQLSNLLASTNNAPRLMSAMHYAALGGGKRVRPLLCFASARLFDQNTVTNTAVLTAACAVELIHAYSLVHDDLPAMDDDDLRRGRPTTHKEFDEATAILAGDALHTLAFEVLSKTSGISSEAVVKSINLLAEASGHAGMAGGQMIDLDAIGSAFNIVEGSSIEASGIDTLVKMHNMKTGALIKASVLLGAIAAGCTHSKQLDALGIYADKIGLAFQIQDDILDCISTTEALGKQQGADAELGKPTYVSLLGLAGAKEKLQLAHQQATHALEIFAEKCLLEEIADYIVARTH